MDSLGQSQELKVNFKAVQSSTIQSKASAAMINNMITEIAKNVDNSFLTSMIADAKAKDTTSFLGGGIMPKDVISDTSNLSNTNITNENLIDLRNVINNTVQNNFTTNVIDTCLNSLIAKQNAEITIKLKDNSTATFGPTTQRQAIESISECNQISQTINEITNSLMNTFGAKSVETISNEGITKQASKSSAESISKGPLDAINDFLATLTAGYAVALGIGSFVSLCCCILCIIFVMFLFGKKG
jgi:hypothetical protein